MSKIENYTLFYNEKDGKMYAGTCREEKEVLTDISIGDPAEVAGYCGDGLTLTLTGLEFETTADIALVLPENATLVLERGVSRLVVHAQGPEANVAALYVKGNMTITGGTGRLICDTTSTMEENCLWSRGVCVRYGDLTQTGGHLEVYCGTCSVRAGALYAGGRLFGGENQHGAITMTGGSFAGVAVPNTVRATNELLTIGPGAIVENSDEYAGSDQVWHGSYLNQKDPEKPVVVRFPD